MSVERRGTKALEYWAKKATQGYAGVNINNMTTSWRDGRAFCALIHHFRPDLIDFDSLKEDNILENNALAFKIAEQHLGIPALLDAEDMVSCEIPDRLSILTYVSQYYQTLSSQGNVHSATKSVVASQNSKNSASSPLTPQKTAQPSLCKAKPIAQSPLLSARKESEFKTDKVAGGVRLKREDCQACKKPVFLAEKILVGDPIELRHRTCFKCARCFSQLTLSNYYVTEKGQFCCETCPDEEKPVNNVLEQTDSSSECDGSCSDSSTQVANAVKPRSIFLQQTILKHENRGDEERPVSLEGPAKPPRIFVDNSCPTIATLPLDVSQTSPGIVSDRLKLFEDKSADDKSATLSPAPTVAGENSKQQKTNTSHIVAEEAEKDSEQEVDEGDRQVSNDSCSQHEQTDAMEETLEIERQPISEDHQNTAPQMSDNQAAPTSNKSLEGPGCQQLSQHEYPDDLNPFGSDEEPENTISPETLSTPEKQETKASLNPFESEDECEAQVEVKSEKQRLNPFWSDDEQDVPNKAKVKPPRPPPPTLKRNESPSTLSSYASSMPASPSPSYRSLTPAGLRIKKKQKPAPTPPGLRSASVTKEGPDVILSSKLEKDKQNMSRMNAQASQNGVSPAKKVIQAPKFELAEWRRKKGPAPPRPMPQKRTIKKLPMSHVHQELRDIDLKQTQLERQGVLLETAIRNKTEPDSNALDDGDSAGVEVEDMILQLFELVNEKNELFRRETELMYLKRERRLEEEHVELEYQIRCLMVKDPRDEEDTKREEELISRLIKVVEQRDQIVNCLELERQREAVEDESIANHMIKYQEKYIDGVVGPEESGQGQKKPKKKKRLKILTKKKKTKEQEKSAKKDADKDVDESEEKASSRKSKNWLKKMDVRP